MTSQTIKGFLLLFVSVPLFGLSFKDSKGNWTSNQATERPLQTIESLIIGTYNVENMFENSVIDPNRNPLEFLPNQRLVQPPKLIKAIKGVAKAILESSYDVLVVAEVENLATLQKFNQYYLNDQYEAFLIEGNDPRGIDVGYFVKKDLPLSVEQVSNKNEMWEDPLNGNKKHKLFSRDLPELYVRTAESAEPMFVLLGTHFKSKIDRPGDPESRILRKAQVERTSEIIKRIEKKQGTSTKIMITGDFNGEVNHEPEFASLHKTAPMYDAFDIVSPPMQLPERITHVYLPKGKPPHHSQLDALLLNKYSSSSVMGGHVYRYKGVNGQPLPIPVNFEQKKENPSDHYPVVVNLEMSSLIK